MKKLVSLLLALSMALGMTAFADCPFADKHSKLDKATAAPNVSSVFRKARLFMCAFII